VHEVGNECMVRDYDNMNVMLLSLKFKHITYSFHKTAAMIFIHHVAASDLVVCVSSTIHIYTQTIHKTAQ